MDPESPNYYRDSPMSEDLRRMSSRALHPSQPEVQCLVCTRPFALDSEVTDSFESLAICRDCKMMVLNDNERNETDIRRRRRRRRSRAASSESTEDSFSQQFSHLINLARQGNEVDLDSPVIARQHGSYASTPNRSQRWRASDNESDGIGHIDSVFGEIESNISFGGYGEDSDASMDRHSLIDREMVIQLDNESYAYTDTDIDPMNAGLDQWNSDDQDDDYGEWEEADLDEAVGAMEQHQQFGNMNSSVVGESHDTAWTWRMAVSQGHVLDIVHGPEGVEFRMPFVRNRGDYVDSRQFEVILEQLAENDVSRRGAPPAAKSFVQNLPSVIISLSDEKNDSLICAVCKDPMPTNTRAKQLPCLHLYHSSCILPWLSSRNSCPVCRFEVPTDDQEYEKSKRLVINDEEAHGMLQHQQQEIVEEISGDTSGETEIDEACDTSGGRTDETRGVIEVSTSSDGAHGRGGWLFLAAAPIVSIVGFVLVMCFRNPPGDRRRRGSHGSQSTMASVDRKGRWWSIF